MHHVEIVAFEPNLWNLEKEGKSHAAISSGQYFNIWPDKSISGGYATQRNHAQKGASHLFEVGAAARNIPAETTGRRSAPNNSPDQIQESAPHYGYCTSLKHRSHPGLQSRDLSSRSLSSKNISAFVHYRQIDKLGFMFIGSWTLIRAAAVNRPCAIRE